MQSESCLFPSSPCRVAVEMVEDGRGEHGLLMECLDGGGGGRVAGMSFCVGVEVLIGRFSRSSSTSKICPSGSTSTGPSDAWESSLMRLRCEDVVLIRRAD